MKQIILNITKNEQGYNLIINSTKEDDSKIIKVVQPENLTEKDEKFINDLKELITNSYGNL